MVSARIAGVIGSSPRAVVVDKARIIVDWVVLTRQGVVAFVVLGEMVRVMA